MKSQSSTIYSTVLSVLLLYAYTEQPDSVKRKVFPTGIWICLSTLRKREFIFPDATRTNMAALTPQSERCIWQVSYCPRPSTPLQTLLEDLRCLHISVSPFPPKQLESRPRGSPSCESSTHIPATFTLCMSTDMYMERVNVHFIFTFIHLIINGEHCLEKKTEWVLMSSFQLT